MPETNQEMNVVGAGREQIAYAKIHPAIGIARVGNSPDEYFLGPESPRPLPEPEGFYRDAQGALKRQAARFRIYVYNAAGEVVQELTCADAEITWSVQVANKKAAWYNFELAMDIPQATPVGRRNANFTGGARTGLEITPSAKSISGVDQAGKAYQFDDGTFLEEPVYLGELRTDDAGRLIFLGGRGVSRTPFAGNRVITFANNDGWYDDTSDGPVTAQVRVEGAEIPVEPAWVVTAPPNYAPDVIGIVSLYDLMVDTYQGWWMEASDRPSFTEDIYPILQHFVMTQWVNRGFLDQFGWGGPNEFLRSDYLDKLSTRLGSHDGYQELRRQIFHAFRNPHLTDSTSDAVNVNENAWPWMYGDDPIDHHPPADAFLAITKTQYGALKQWVTGEFAEDWDPARVAPKPLEEYPVGAQPAALDRAALEYCLGGPFHPGCEMTWTMRHIVMYVAPFRIRHRSPQEPESDYGDVLSPTLFQRFNERSPLFASGPGDITRWMAVPWQTDTASCRAGYAPAYDPYLPTFWPARVPNHVLSAADYALVMDLNLPRADRVAAFHRRSAWTRWLGDEESALGQINRMITDFFRLGVVERRPGVVGDPDFPPVMYVETTPEEVKTALQAIPFDRNTVAPRSDKRSRPRSLSRSQ